MKFGAHQLEGPAASWWENSTATFPVDTVTWDQFQQAFHTAHVSAGAMAMKKHEFRNLRQGGRTVGRYVDDFSKLARYAMEVTIIMEEVRTTIVAPRMAMGMEEATVRTVPTQQRPPRRI